MTPLDDTLIERGLKPSQLYQPAIFSIQDDRHARTVSLVDSTTLGAI
jgi:hypothetical protein